MTEPRMLPRTTDLHRPYTADPERYNRVGYRQVGTSGLYLPPISLGLWWNFGDNIPLDNQRALLRHAFDSGITHFDLANNYGPPPGSAEKNFGRILAEDLRPYRDELIISSKAGWDMWQGPYGYLGSRKYIIASAEQSLTRMGLDYVDIFYSHRVDPDTPVEETVGALDALVRQGKALYVGISSYSAERTEAAMAVARELGTPLVIHQPSYSILNRWIEDGLTDTLRSEGLGAIAFTPLAQGLLTGKYLADGTAERAQKRGSLPDAPLSAQGLTVLRELNDVAQQRGQSLAQMAIQWTLRDPVVASALIGASRPEQLDENLAAVDGAAFSAEELARIDAVAGRVDVNLWSTSSDL
ncbi:MULTISPECIES: L-glyceraldehyde 3-phosphate reductase [unclassified Microbacterium]|uniref:L-glyceraldehyde 3-phosphate reductase n=1 Tax=unclassified Microbacterium TaxID=2609290 RepID=UPI0012FBAE10|nr:L-glyceraldehyde 3-phosphate reductase [Microbacterium sp. MAH-37]MVQ41145.1 L-glyceraldehyde 3-phosphate reductase [Microbacterium sp. MAH-37]